MISAVSGSLLNAFAVPPVPSAANCGVPPVKSNAYDANLAHLQSQARRLMPRRIAKLHTNDYLFLIGRHCLNLLWSPQQIANILKAM
jgi:hypothetical protein